MNKPVKRKKRTKKEIKTQLSKYIDECVVIEKELDDYRNETNWCFNFKNLYLAMGVKRINWKNESKGRLLKNEIRLSVY